MECETFLKDVKAWAQQDGDIGAIILVGSYARGEQRPDSDVDIVLLTYNRDKFLSDVSLYERFGDILETGIEHYGAVTSVRVWYEPGIDVEFGITGPEWASLPLDEGTEQVLKDGFCVIEDKDGLFRDIQFCCPAKAQNDRTAVG